MKGYNLNGTLYIFDATPATIPGDAGDEADLIYVQQELVEEFKYENPDNSAKIKPYNYKLMAVNKLPWADYVNEDIPEDVEPTTYSITLVYTEAAQAQFPDGLPTDPQLPFNAEAGANVDISLPYDSDWYTYRDYNYDSETAVTDQQFVIMPDIPIGSAEFAAPSVDTNGYIRFTMPENDVNITIDFAENPDYVNP